MYYQQCQNQNNSLQYLKKKDKNKNYNITLINLPLQTFYFLNFLLLSQL